MKIDIDFPDPVQQALQAAASAQGLNLNAFVVALLETELAVPAKTTASPQFVTQEVE